EDGAYLEGCLVRARDEHDVAPDGVSDGAGQKGIVGAAEQEGVNPGVADRFEQALGEDADLVGVSVASFDDLHEPRAGRTGESDAGPLIARGPLVRARA